MIQTISPIISRENIIGMTAFDEPNKAFFGSVRNQVSQLDHWAVFVGCGKDEFAARLEDASHLGEEGLGLVEMFHNHIGSNEMEAIGSEWKGVAGADGAVVDMGVVEDGVVEVNADDSLGCHNDFLDVLGRHRPRGEELTTATDVKPVRIGGYGTQ